MSLDGNGTYSPPAPQFPAIPNTIIYASDFNTIILDIATALSTAIFRDGQAAFTANQSMGGNKLTNLANGTAAQDAVTVLQVFTDPTFTATTVDGVTVTGTKLTVTTTTVALPADTSIGNVSATELSYLDGVTSSLQTQLDSKITNGGVINDGTTATTQPAGTSNTLLATCAFVMQAAFNAGLPAQSSLTIGMVPMSDGVNASWRPVPPSLPQAYTYGGF
jgi:hypothetical protein